MLSSREYFLMKKVMFLSVASLHGVFGWYLLAGLWTVGCVSIRHPIGSCPGGVWDGVFSGVCLCSLMFPLVFEGWKCFLTESNLRQVPEKWPNMLSSNSLRAQDTILWQESRREGMWRLGFNFSGCNCRIISWLCPCVLLWVTFGASDLSLNGFCIITLHFYLHLWPTKRGPFLSRIWFRCCLDDYLSSYLLVSSTQ